MARKQSRKTGAPERTTLEILATGVPGLDQILGGGLPALSFNLVAGGPGTGKTTLVMQLLFANASPARPGLFLTLLGEGARFSLYLPAVAEPLAGERRGTPRPEREYGGHAGSTVLLVEDEPGVRTVAARLLKLAGFRVLEASDGVKALQMVDRHGPPDLVLADAVMPAMGGAELARRVRARWPALPVLLMSGYSAEELRQQGALGSSEKVTIPKPFTPEGLVWAVTAALSQERAGRPHPTG